MNKRGKSRKGGKSLAGGEICRNFTFYTPQKKGVGESPSPISSLYEREGWRHSMHGGMSLPRPRWVVRMHVWRWRGLQSGGGWSEGGWSLSLVCMCEGRERSPHPLFPQIHAALGSGPLPFPPRRPCHWMREQRGRGRRGEEKGALGICQQNCFLLYRKRSQ